MRMYINTIYKCCIHSVACNWMSCATYLMQLHKFVNDSCKIQISSSEPWFHGWTLFHKNLAFQPWTFVCICEWKSSIENSQMRLHGCSYVEFGWINATQKNCEWTTLHGRNKIYMIFLGALFHSKFSWIFMDGLLFHKKRFDSTTFIKVDKKETWNLNSKPFNLLSICFKDILEGTLNFEMALVN
jgi:hypothetical protein